MRERRNTNGETEDLGKEKKNEEKMYHIDDGRKGCKRQSLKPRNSSIFYARTRAYSWTWVRARERRIAYGHVLQVVEASVLASSLAVPDSLPILSQNTGANDLTSLHGKWRGVRNEPRIAERKKERKKKAGERRSATCSRRKRDEGRRLRVRKSE